MKNIIFHINSIAWSKHRFLFDSTGILLNFIKKNKAIEDTEGKIFILNFYLRSKYNFSENPIHFIMNYQLEAARLGVLVENKELSFSMIYEILYSIFIIVHSGEKNFLKYRKQPFDLVNLKISEFACDFKADDEDEHQLHGIVKVTDLSGKIYTFVTKNHRACLGTWIGGMCYIFEVMEFFCFRFNYIKKSDPKKSHRTKREFLIYTQNIPLQLIHQAETDNFFENIKYNLSIYRSDKESLDIRRLLYPSYMSKELWFFYNSGGYDRPEHGFF